MKFSWTASVEKKVHSNTILAWRNTWKRVRHPGLWSHLRRRRRRIIIFFPLVFNLVTRSSPKRKRKKKGAGMLVKNHDACEDRGWRVSWEKLGALAASRAQWEIFVSGERANVAGGYLKNVRIFAVSARWDIRCKSERMYRSLGSFLPPDSSVSVIVVEEAVYSIICVMTRGSSVGVRVSQEPRYNLPREMNPQRLERIRVFLLFPPQKPICHRAAVTKLYQRLVARI